MSFFFLLQRKYTQRVCDGDVNELRLFFLVIFCFYMVTGVIFIV